MRHEHRAGDKLFVDYAGHTIPIYPPDGPSWPGASCSWRCWGPATTPTPRRAASQQLGCWIGAHVRAFEFYGAAPALLVPDNLRSGVTSAHRYEPLLNRTYAEMAAHYGSAILPARQQAPGQGQGRGRGADRRAVDPGQPAQRAVHQPRRGQHRDPRAAGVVEQPPVRQARGHPPDPVRAARPPGDAAAARDPLRVATWKTPKVNIDYHVDVDRHYYSVPYQLVGHRVDVRVSEHAVEVVLPGPPGGQPPPQPGAGRPHAPSDAHMPERHRAHLAWNPERIIAWAARTGPATAELVDRDHGQPPAPRAGLPLLSGHPAPGPALPDRPGSRPPADAPWLIGARSYRSVESILAHGLDAQPLPAPMVHDEPARSTHRAGTSSYAAPATTSDHPNRPLGKDRTPSMLINPTLEKLHALRLAGMATALAEQLERPDRYAELDFTARLGLLVDREAQDRDNRRLTRNLKTATLRAPACVEDIDFRRPRGLDRTQILALAEAGWVSEHRDLLITGATGSGQDLPGLRAGPRRDPPRPPRALLRAAPPARRPAPRPRRRHAPRS